MIDIVMPVLNTEEKFLSKSIQSVIDQTYKDWKLWICLDSEHTLEYKSLPIDTRIYWIKSRGHGYSVTRNTALDECKAPYVAFLDSDDLMRPNKLERLQEIVNEHKPDIIIHKLEYLDQDFNPRPIELPWGGTQETTCDVPNAGFMRLLSGCLPSQCIIKNTNHRFDEEFDRKGVHYEDWDFFYHLPINKFHFTSEILGGKTTPYQKTYDYSYLEEKNLGLNLSHQAVPQELQNKWKQDELNYRNS